MCHLNNKLIFIPYWKYSYKTDLKYAFYKLGNWKHFAKWSKQLEDKIQRTLKRKYYLRKRREREAEKEFVSYMCLWVNV